MTARSRRIGGGPMLVLLLLLLVVSVTAAVTIGPSDVGAADVWRVVADHLGFASDATPTENAIVWEIRLPRVLLAATVGAGLALVGAVMQATMRNPLADPYLLGISAGASFGAVVVFVGLGGAAFGLTTGAFGGAMVAFAAVLVLGAGRAVADRTRAHRPRRRRRGLAVRRRAPPLARSSRPPIREGTRGILYWLLGSLAGATWSDLAIAVPRARRRAVAVTAGAGPAAERHGDRRRRRRRGRRRRVARPVAAARHRRAADRRAGRRQRGDRVRRPVAAARHPRSWSAATTGSCCRRWRSPARSFLVWVDTFARTAFDPQEIPVGVATALIGAPAFAYLLARADGAAMSIERARHRLVGGRTPDRRTASTAASSRAAWSA